MSGSVSDDTKVTIGCGCMLLIGVLAIIGAVYWARLHSRQRALARMGVHMGLWDILVLDPRVVIVNGSPQVMTD